MKTKNEYACTTSAGRLGRYYADRERTAFYLCHFGKHRGRNSGFSAEPYFNAFLSGKRAVGVDLLKNIRMLNDGHSLEMLMRNEAESARHPPDLEDDDLLK